MATGHPPVAKDASKVTLSNTWLVLGRELRGWGYLEFFHKELRSYPPG